MFSLNSLTGRASSGHNWITAAKGNEFRPDSIDKNNMPVSFLQLTVVP